MEMGGGQAAIFPQRTTRIGKKETFRLILSSGLDCFSQRQEPGNAGSAENGKRRNADCAAGAFPAMTAMSSPALIREKLAAHGDLNPIAFWILYFADLHRKVDCTHNAITKLLMNQLFDCFSINESDFVKPIY